jgi:hypothetical protein
MAAPIRLLSLVLALILAAPVARAQPDRLIAAPEVQPAWQQRAHHRLVVGRGLTIAGLAALVVGFGVGAPLISHASSHQADGVLPAGMTLTVVLGGVGTSLALAGAPLWIMGAGDERRAAEGYNDWGALSRRRVKIGQALVGLGAAGVAVALSGFGVVFASECSDTPYCNSMPAAAAGMALLATGAAMTLGGLLAGSTLLNASQRDRRLSLALGAGGLRGSF